MVRVQRTRDKQTYLKESRYEQPKEIFKLLRDRSVRDGALQDGATVRDFGCAAGEFLYHLSRTFPSADYWGYDPVPELLDKARQQVPGVAFEPGSVLDDDLVPAESTDLAFMLGVHSIFDEFEPCLSNLIRWTRRGGRIYVFGMFNPHPIDVWVKYRPVGHPNPDHREPGWNIFSKASVAHFLDATLGAGKHDFTRFEMPFQLDADPSDPVRSWTFVDSQGRRLFTNGLSLICNLEILEIRV